MPSVSVVIPTHNRADLLRQAIGSVLAQTYPDFEVLVVDDGSTDATADTVARIQDARVRYLYQAHGERSTARNRGLAAAEGAYITFLDDDDLYLPHKLASDVAFMAEHPEVDLLCGGTQLAYPGGVVKVVRPWREQPEPTLRNCLYGQCRFPTCSVAFRRRMLHELDHWFDPQASLTEDADFFLRTNMAGLRLAWLPEVVATYRLIHTERTLRILVDYGRAWFGLLDQLMARADMPAELRAEQAQIRLHHRYQFAAQAYAYRLPRLAQSHLLRTLILDSTSVSALPPSLERAIVKIATDGWVVPDARAYVDFVFDNLPTPLAALQGCRDEVWRVLCAQSATVAEREALRNAS